MGTRYEEVYERYRGQVRNYEFLDYDAVTREAMQLDLLKMAISDFEDCGDYLFCPGSGAGQDGHR